MQMVLLQQDSDKQILNLMLSKMMMILTLMMISLINKIKDLEVIIIII